MSSTAPAAPPRRPREVTLGGLAAVVGGACAVLLALQGAQELDSKEMRDALADLVKSEQADALGLTVESARTLLRYTLMALGVASVMSLVLGVFVLRRHRGSRVALTVLGGIVGGLCLLAGPPGWFVSGYVGGSLALLWTRRARDWFAEPMQPGRPSPTAYPSGPSSPPPPPPPPRGR